MDIKNVPIESLSLDPSNVRSHNEKNLQAICASLKRFGQQKPIVIDKNNLVRAGNGTLQAAQALGWKTISVVCSDLESAEMIAYAIADNRTAELASWDMDGLKEQLGGLDEELREVAYEDFPITEEILPNEKDDDIPDTDSNELDVRLGDLWLLGEHRLVCGDCTDVLQVDRLLDGLKPTLMSTDPPYGVELDQSWRDKALGDKALGAGNKRKILNDNIASWPSAYALFPGNICYVWHASSFTDVVKKDLIDCGFDVRQMIIWNKSIMVMGRSAYHWKHEPCWYAVRKGKDANWKGDRKQTTVWDAQSPNHIMSGSKEEKTNHPSQKPSILSETPILNHTVAGDSVYDPFLGSGSTLIACEKTKRQCFGMEIDPHYCSVIIKRWQEFTGLEATRG